jgi:hypothetical protein
MGFLEWLLGKLGNGETRELTPPVVLPPSAPRLPVAPVAASIAPPSTYSIEMAIELMRTLPFDEDAELVLRVLRKTLRSTGVSVEEVIVSAQNRESALSTSAAKDLAAIEQLEHEIVARRASIARLETELAETRTVRERLEEAIEEETKVVMALPEDEVERLQADAEAAKQVVPPPIPSFPPMPDKKPESPPAPRSQAPATPRSMPPLPKVGAPPIPKKSLPPKPHASMPPMPPRSVKPPTPPTPTIAEPEVSSDAVTKD